MKKTREGLQPGSLGVDDPLMEKALTALQDLGAHEGALVLRLGMDHGELSCSVTVLKAGSMTESMIERMTPLIFQQVLQQRMALARAEQAERDQKVETEDALEE